MDIASRLRAKKGRDSWATFIARGLAFRLWRVADPLLMPRYRATIATKIKRLSRKDSIAVAFIVPELGFWKTEALYLAMLNHPRFRPQLLVVPSTEVPNGPDAVVDYARQRGYNYVDLRSSGKAIGSVSPRPDIIFYEKPYDYSLPPKYNFRYNAYALFCYVSYCFHNANVRQINETPLINAAWQVYYENQDVMAETERLMLHPQPNGRVTGLPNADDLTSPSPTLPLAWKDMGDNRRRKRIVWAPHHSVAPGHHDGMDYSTFLAYADFMLAMATKYADHVQMAFKPHPLLRANLEAVWSRERIDSYYHKWQELPNTQLELGDYKALFTQSDAMVHDCGSFTIEYLYTRHPVMYLLKHDNHDAVLNQFATNAFNMHYKGYTADDVEQFILNVIDGHDPLSSERQRFFETQLLPPEGRSAADNILAAIEKELYAEQTG
jgi:hypothetical protein